MKDPRREYEAALADFAQPGGRWNAKGRLTYWGKAAGLTADEIVADARAQGVTDRDADIRRGWADARPKGDRPNTNYTPRATKPKPPPTFPSYVRDLIGDIGKAKTATAEDVRRLSPYWWPAHANPALAQTAPFLRLFDPADVLHVFRDDAPAAGKPGANLMPCRDWLEIVEDGGKLPGDLIVPNPFTGADGETADGRKSYIAQSCLARFPFVVVEFDQMPLAFQFAFWRGLLSTSPLAPKVAAVVFSGGKSLHGLIHAGCATLAEWRTVQGRLRGLLAADPDPAFKADEQAMRPRTGTRLPGVPRFSNGNRQELLYLNPYATRPRPQETAHTRPAAQTDKDAPQGDGRATGRNFAATCDCVPDAPPPPSRYCGKVGTGTSTGRGTARESRGECEV